MTGGEYDMNRDRAALVYEEDRLDLEYKVLRSFKEDLYKKNKNYAGDYVNEAAEQITKAMLCLRMAHKYIDDPDYEQIKMDLPE